MSPAEAFNTQPGNSQNVILIVDDEIGIREFLCAYLQSKDFKVYSACSGEEAYKVWCRIPEKVDLLITDIIMPGMHGKALAEKLRLECPELQVIFMSGYLPEEIAEEALSGTFFRKPFHPHELLKAIREALH